VARFSQFQTAPLHPETDQKPMLRVRPFEVGIEAALRDRRIDAPFAKMALRADVSFSEELASVHTGVLLVSVCMDYGSVEGMPTREVREFAGRMAHRATELTVREVGWNEADLFHDVVTAVAQHVGAYEEIIARTRDTKRRLLHVTRSEVDDDGTRVVLDSLRPDGSVFSSRIIWSRDIPDRPRWRFPAWKCVLVEDVLEYRDRDGRLLASVDLG
jgi:hypothetical protein